MKTVFKFLKTTILGGIFFLLPLVVTILLLREALHFIAKLAVPLAKILPFDSVIGIRTPYLLAVLILILIGFLAGLLAKTGLGNKFNRWLEQSLLRKIPGYNLLRGVTQDVKGGEGPSNFPVALAHFGDNVWQLCFIIEHLEGGHITVFAPGSPSPTSGTVCFLPSSQVKEVDIPMASVMKCMVQIGVGSQELLKGKLSSPEGSSVEKISLVKQ